MPCCCDYDEYVPKPPKKVKDKNTSENKIIENLKTSWRRLERRIMILKQMMIE